MSRSYAHKPKISWIGYQSNKEDKRIANGYLEEYLNYF